MHAPRHLQPLGLGMVEVLIVLTIVGVLAGMAWPSFVEQVRKGRRGEAVLELHRASLALERWRATRATFTANVGSPDGLALADVGAASSYVVASGRYRITVEVPDGMEATHYRIVATATGDMAGDAACQSMGLSVSHGVVLTTATPSGHARRCWGL